MRVSQAMGAGLLLVLVAGMAGSSSGAGVDGSAPDIRCVFVRESHVLRVEYGVRGEPDRSPVLFMDRAGDRIRLQSGHGLGSPVRCEGGQPTVRNTDRIELGAVADVQGTETYIDFHEGLFEPGATPEPGGDEIEINTNLGPNAAVALFGTSGDDDWVLGSRRKERYFANFNPAEGQPDRDLDVAFAPVQFGANLGLGDDRITAKGGAGTGGAVSTGVYMIGMDVNDRLVGGPRDDDLLGYEGNDLLVGGSGDDKLDRVGGKGRDTLICGPGRDKFRSSRKDNVRC